MSLLARAAILIFIVSTIGLAALSQIGGQIIESQFLKLESEDFSKDISRLDDAIGAQFTQQASKNGDWSVWDDPYKFTQDLNTDFIQTNQTNNSFVQLQITAMLFYDQHGVLVQKKAVDTDTETEVAMPPILPDTLGPLVFPADALEGERQLFVSDGEKLYLVTGRPILNSEGGGPNHGTLFFIKEADSAFVAELGQVTHNDISLKLLPTLEIGNDIQLELIADNDKTLVKPIDKSRIKGYLLSVDDANKPVAVWEVERERKILDQGRRTILTFTIFFSVTGFLFAIVVLFAMYWLILRRLAAIAKTADRLGDLSIKVRLPATGSDEISRLSQAINRLLDRLDQAFQLATSDRKSLEKKNKDLEVFNQTMVDREIRMIELKEELKKLKGEKG